jgi:2,3-bisphosphoglycerate-independent phosphoglycerate mutase
LKYIILLGDGMADFPLPDLNNRTPIEVAFTPSMDEAASTGVTGLFSPIPADLPPGSDIGNLSLFGYDPHATFTGRAPLEAANQGITLKNDQIAFRCNLVTLQDGVMEDFTAGHITTEEANEIIQSLNSSLTHLPVRFHTGVGYRHIAVVTAPDASFNDLARLQCTPPHDITGQPYARHIPTGPASVFVHELMAAAHPILADHPVNAARIAAGKPPASAIWLWGQGRTPTLESFRSRFGLTGAVISAVDLIRGIGLVAGLEVIPVTGATGYLDTNYLGKVSAAIEALRRVDFVYLHVEAPDETSHQGRVDLKIRAIEDFDARVVAPFMDYLRAHPNTRLLVAPDHVTAISTKTHAHGPVPFAICGQGVQPDDAVTYSESAARATGVLIDRGHLLLPHVIQAPAITRESLISLAK